MKNKVKSLKNINWIWVAEMILALLICLFHSIAAGHYANFYPINGTFQNFNPVRRLIAGQIPYRDFQDYLGLGHLYTGTIFTLLFGGDYRGSLQAFSFLSILGLGLCFFAVAIAITGKKEIALAFVNSFLVLSFIEPSFFKSTIVGTEDMLMALEYALSTGNSARFIRGMILPLSCALAYIGYVIYANYIETRIKNDKIKPYILYGGVGIVGGFCFPWSNDYGISCWLCFTVMTFWIALSRERKKLSVITYTLTEIVVSLFTVFIVVEIFTVGHFGTWFTSTFATGGYQAWYYNSKKSFYFTDVDFSFITLLQASLAVVYLARLFKTKCSKEALKRYGLLAFANMSCFAAVNEYHLLSGNDSREVALVILFINITLELAYFISGKENLKLEKFVGLASIILAVSWVVPAAKDEFVFRFLTELDGKYNEALGGNIVSYEGDLSYTGDFLGGDKFFATYASAQEVVENTFQPSGIDYIIHVLSDKQREKYIDTFKQGDFKYAATIKEEFSGWEYWVQRANWFFYRELYNKWHPVYANSYELYWERNEEENSNRLDSGFEVRVEDVDEATKKLIVNCDSDVYGMADVYLDYAIRKKDGLGAKLLFKTMLRLENTGDTYAEYESFESNYLRSESAEYIPLPIVGGYGELTITSDPKKNTYLILNQVRCDCIYTVAADYITIASIDNAEGECRIMINNTDKNDDFTKDIKGVEYDGEHHDVEDVETSRDYICITTKGNIDRGVSNQIKLVR